MSTNYRLLCGPLAATFLSFGITGLALLIPGYSQVRQTVSEIGEIGSPARVPFAILLCIVAACTLAFASGVRDVARKTDRSPFAAYLTALMALSAAGVGVFAFPHPLHNVFGISELFGYQAPLALALTWRHDPLTKSVVRFSWIMCGLVSLALGLNLVAMDRHGTLWAHAKPVYGLIQRALFAAWFGWCVGVCVLLLRENAVGRPS